MRGQLVLAWRLHRAELVALAVAAIGLSASAVAVAFRLDGLMAGCRAATELVAPCGGPAEMGMIYDTASASQMGLTIGGLAMLPFAAGIVLGAPLVARELEQGTALLAWPLARSRARWLAVRLLPLAVLGVAILLVPAMAGEVLIRALYPPIDPGTNFEGYGMRGPVMVVRFLAVLAAAALVGTWARRQLPALLLAGVMAGAMAVGLMQVQRLLAEPVEQSGQEFERGHVGSLYVDTRYRAQDGSWMPEEQAWELLGGYEEGEEPDPSTLPQEVMYVIPRERYPDVVARESAGLLGLSLGLGALLVVVVRRRRPG